MKITIIGGGSYSWTPLLVRNFLTNDFFKGSTICLMDTNETSLNDLYNLCVLYKSMTEEKSLCFHKTTSLGDALSGASYVVVAISHGGLDAELEDHRIARKYGYYNMKGSEVGIAGCSRTLRHVPEIVRIAAGMEKKCPEAMLLNVTNPLTACTRAINKYSFIKSVGFCHGVINHLWALFPFFGADGLDGVDFTVAGVDHCSWLLELKYRGENVLEIMRHKGLIDRALKGENIGTVDDPFAGRENQRLRFLIWNIIGYMPAISDEHCIEFFGQIMKNNETRNFYKVDYDRIKERSSTVQSARHHVKEILAGTRSPDTGRCGEVIDKFIASLNGESSFIDVMNCPNKGQIPNLPFDSVVESKCLIDSNGVHPIQAGNLPPILESIVRPIIIREELYMEAAMDNDVKKLRSALSTDPLVNDFHNIDAICEDLMNYNRQFN